MTAMFRMELTSALLVFAGHAASLFLMSLRRYTFRRSVMIWAGVLGLSALLTVALLWLSPAEGFLAGQVASLALCAVVFLCTSRGNFLRNLFIFASYINFFLFSIAASQALAASVTVSPVWANLVTADEVLAFAATSNICTNVDGLYMEFLIALPVANCLDKKLSPVFFKDKA